MFRSVATPIVPRLAVALLCASLVACAGSGRRAGPAAAAAAPGGPPVLVTERFVTPASPADEIDSVATWHAGDGRILLLATAKSGGRVLVYDAANGALLGPLGGDSPPPLQRPNGIAIVDDLAFIVDQQRHVIELVRLPGGQPLGSIGAGALRNPYGLWVQRDGDDYLVHVTDSYRLDDNQIPPPQQLGERVRRLRVQLEPGKGPAWRQEHAFGATEGDGVLRTVESLAGDPRHDRLLVAEEELDAPSGLSVYRMDGQFTGQRIAEGVYVHQAEGIALVGCDDGSGYWIASDQDPEDQRFHVLDRASLRWLGSFRGATVRDTDGVAFERGPLPGFAHGAVYAQHDNRAVVAFDWAEVAAALDLRAGCD